MDRPCGENSVHQGIAEEVHPCACSHSLEFLGAIESRGQTPLFVALDGVTDPCNVVALTAHSTVSLQLTRQMLSR